MQTYYNDDKMKPNIGILTFPISESGNIPLSNLVDILHPPSDSLHLITGNDGYVFFKDDQRLHVYGVPHSAEGNTFKRVLKYFYAQVSISYKLLKITKNVDILIFFIGGDTIVLPMLIAKLFRKKVFIAFAGSSVHTHQFIGDRLFKLLAILSKINCFLSDGIILYSKNLINEFHLEKHRNKIFIAREHHLDLNEFNIKKSYAERENLLGYIGRFSEEKGILNLINAIPQILSIRDDIKFILIGDGTVRSKIEKFLSDNKLYDTVKIEGWVSHDKLPDYLNELKLIVLPSYTEGLPNVLLEAMACNTPVLATSIGAIPDIIKDDENGFLMENNSPECIALNIDRVFNHPDLVSIADNTGNLVKKEFTFEATMKRYSDILGEIWDVKSNI